MAYHVYILQSLKDSKYYIGSTSDVEARLRFHNAGLQRSTRNTVFFGLALTEIFRQGSILNPQETALVLNVYSNRIFISKLFLTIEDAYAFGANPNVLIIVR